MGRIMGIQINPCKRKRYKPTTLQKWIDKLKAYKTEMQPFLRGDRNSIFVLDYQDITELLEVLEHTEDKT